MELDEREVLRLAILGADTEIIINAKELDADRTGNADCALYIVQFAEIRRKLGERLKVLDEMAINQ